jgi:prepilin-type N-terminal cleavage/methylation domain-containing protein
MKSNAGFTLVEMLIALVVTMIIMGGAYSVFMSQQKNTVVQTDVSDIQQTLRAAMDFMVRDIRMTGYPGPDRDPDINPGFIAVGEDFLQFSLDMNDDGILDPLGAETVTYALDNNQPAVAPGSTALMRNGQPMAGYVTNIGFAFAIDYNQDGELDRGTEFGNQNVLWVVDTGIDGFWRNLDTNDDGQINAADGGGGPGKIGGSITNIPVRLGDIRAVRIWLLGRSLSPDNSYTDNNLYVVGSTVLQPNDNFRRRLLERTVLCRNMGLKK